MSEFTLKKIPEILKEIPADLSTNAITKFLYRYDGMVEFMDSPEVLTTILFYQESVMSSRLEGTIATLTDLLDVKVGKEVSEKIKDDSVEIENYKDALGYCIKEIENKKYKFDNSLFKNIQYILLDKSKDHNKLKGKYKERQNYIGNKYDKEITYTPVSYLHTEEYMNDLITFMNDDTVGLDPIIKLAIIHAYFELIHPFEDGNGRVGRILIPILLKKYNVLSTPYFYISYYFSKHRNDYIGTLEHISKNNDWTPWIKFFLRAMEKQAEVLINMLRQLKEIKLSTEEKIQSLNSTFSLQIINFLFRRIKFNTTTFVKETGIVGSTARSLLEKMEKNGIIEVEEKGSGQSATIYKFIDLYQMVEEIKE